MKSNDLKMFKAIRTQTLAIIARVTADPTAEYTIDGQVVSWADYLIWLSDAVVWCERKMM